MPVIFCAFIIPANLSFPASAQIPRTAATRFNQPNITNDQKDGYDKKCIEAASTKNLFYEGPAGQTHHCRGVLPRETFHLICWASVNPPAAFCSLTSPLCSHPLPAQTLPPPMHIPVHWAHSHRGEKPLCSPCKSRMTTGGKNPSS